MSVTSPPIGEPALGDAPPVVRSVTMERMRRPLAPTIVTLVAVLAVIGAVLWQCDPALLLANTTTTGGDTGAHVGLAAYLQSHLLMHFQLTGWFPGAYDGLPLYTFYFPFADMLAGVAGWVIPFNIAFKFVTLLGSLTLPVAAWAFGRLAGLERPRPAVLALAALPFLFDQSYTIYGGNLFSTMAGEYSYSFALSVALVFLGVVVRGMRTGRMRAAAAGLLAICMLSHLVPAMFALAGVGVLFLLGPPSWRRLWWVVTAVGTGLLLVAFWAVPFATEQSLATNMGWLNVTTYAALLAPGGNRWALALAAVGTVVAIVRLERSMIVFTVLGALSALAVVFDPQGKLYNTRFVPLWWICVYLLAAYAVAEFGVALAVGGRRLRSWISERDASAWAGGAPVPGAPAGMTAPRPGSAAGMMPPPLAGSGAPAYGPLSPRRYAWAPGAVGVPIAALIAVLLAFVPTFVVGPSTNITLGPFHVKASNVKYWAEWNYAGYQGKAAWPEMEAVVATMEGVSRRYGCGRAMWEYNSNLDRFGTPMAPMLLPYWTDGCIDSQEGLLFESSATTPYHFIDQAELSAAPSEAVVASTTGIDYGPVDVALGVQHLQLLGVRYFMATSPAVQAQADVDPDLTLVATTGPWRDVESGQSYVDTWKIYVVKDTAMVAPLTQDPTVVTGVAAGQPTWFPLAQKWYADPAQWSRELVLNGPASWPRASGADAMAGDPSGRDPLPTVHVSDIRTSDDEVRFHVDRIGVPVLVRISYFPNWQATGAQGPYRAAPNLMVVVPTSRDVTLYYGTSPAGRAGEVLTFAGVLAFVVLVVRRRRGFTMP